MTARRSRRRQPSPIESPILWLAVLLGLLSTGAAAKGAEHFGEMIIILVIIIGLAIIGALWAFMRIRSQRRQRAHRALEIAHIDQMTGVEFEGYVASVLGSRGYKTTTTPLSGDFGVDLIAKRDNEQIAIQIKRYRAHLNQDPIRQAAAGMKHYKCNRSMVVTNSYFTTSAKVLATSNQCELVDRDKLAEWIIEFGGQSTQ